MVTVKPGVSMSARAARGRSDVISVFRVGGRRRHRCPGLCCHPWVRIPSCGAGHKAGLSQAGRYAGAVYPGDHHPVLPPAINAGGCPQGL